MRHSMQDYPIHEMAPTCLYLALKVEERMQIKITAVARAAKYELKEVTKPHLQVRSSRRSLWVFMLKLAPARKPFNGKT